MMRAGCGSKNDPLRIGEALLDELDAPRIEALNDSSDNSRRHADHGRRHKDHGLNRKDHGRCHKDHSLANQNAFLNSGTPLLRIRERFLPYGEGR